MNVLGINVQVGKEYAVTYRNERGQCHYALSRGKVDSFKGGNILFQMAGHGFRSFKPERIEEIIPVDTSIR